ncbi:MAG: hypothetical protein D6675_00545 [Gemmatimonadetes bacterium]|nr:MAG: hypothetical protein D6675_00545 [Gemmatimonadota bacterium]
MGQTWIYLPGKQGVPNRISLAVFGGKGKENLIDITYQKPYSKRKIRSGEDTKENKPVRFDFLAVRWLLLKT